MRRLILTFCACAGAGLALAAPASAETLTPASATFSPTEVGSRSETIGFTLSGGTGAPPNVSVTGSFTQVHNCPALFPPATECTINVAFEPTSASPVVQTGTLSAGGQTAQLTGKVAVAAKKKKCKKGKKGAASAKKKKCKKKKKK